LIVTCADHDKAVEVTKSFKGKVIKYGRELPINKTTPDYYSYKNVTQTKDGLRFTISIGGASYAIQSPMLGLYQAENITACFAMAHQLGVSPEIIVASIAQFQGLKRRMEKRYEGDITVIDDIAHSPEKASSVLNTLKSIYTGKVIAVFEPNIGGRSRESLGKYCNAFRDADLVVIPRLTKLKIAEEEKNIPIEGAELAAEISKTHSNVQYIDDDEKVSEFLTKNSKKGDVIAFLGSHGFRGMIEEMVKRIG